MAKNLDDSNFNINDIVISTAREVLALIDGQEDIMFSGEELLDPEDGDAEVVMQVSEHSADHLEVVFVERRYDNGERKLRANDNCLQGMRCPRCGSLDKFKIAINTIATFGDDGDAEDHSSDSSWDDESYCECVDCRYDNNVRMFKDDPFYCEVEILHTKYRGESEIDDDEASEIDDDEA